jgi:hypothetical protein
MTNGFFPLAERFEDETEAEVILSPSLLNVMAVAEEHDLSWEEYLQLSQYCISVVVSDLCETIETDMVVPEAVQLAATTAAMTRLQIAYDLIEEEKVGFGDAEEEGEGE